MSKWNHKQAYANHMKKRPNTNTMAPTTDIDPKYFTTPHPHRGEVLNAKNVFGPKTRKDTDSVWRVWVRIRTTEGWTLMGYIGEKQREIELPSVMRGDKVTLDPLILSDYRRMAGKDERPKDFSRQLHGKILRGGTGVTRRVASKSVLMPYENPLAEQEKEMRDSFDCPKVWAMKSKCGQSCVGFVPNIFKPNELASFGVTSFSLDTTEAKPVWRWRGTLWIAKDAAVEKWGALVAQGYGDKFDLIADPLNADECDRHPADRYATLYSGQSNNFPSLVNGGWFPRKKVTA